MKLAKRNWLNTGWNGCRPGGIFELHVALGFATGLVEASDVATEGGVVGDGGQGGLEDAARAGVGYGCDAVVHPGSFAAR